MDIKNIYILGMEHKKMNNKDTTLRSSTYEYRVIDHNMFDEEEIITMNSMGSNGWEIIKILEPMNWLNSEGMFIRIYYKREKQS